MRRAVRATGFKTAAWSEALIAVLLGLAASTAVMLFAPPAQDLAAHVYRANLVDQGVFLWDNYWYAGDYPLATYSLLAPIATAVVGVAPLLIVCTGAAAGLFSLIVMREWGPDAAWPSRAFACAAALPLLPGLDAYVVGVPLLLGSLAFAQSGRRFAAIVCATLTLAASPLAFVFLLGAAISIALAGRCSRRTGIVLGSALLALGAAEVVLARVAFQTTGVYPFLSWNLLAVVGLASSGALLAYRSRRMRPIAWLLAGWGGISIVSFLIANPVGDNLARLRYAVFPLLLLVALQDKRRRLALCLAASALVYACVPDLVQVSAQADARSARAAYWAGAVRFLHAHLRPGQRVEVVATSARWEAYFLPTSGIPLARGWFRQTDLGSNRVLYGHTLSGFAYRRWLDERAVSYVLLTRGPLDDHGAASEARLLRLGRSGLLSVWHAGGLTIYAVPGPTPLVSGPSRAIVTAFTHTQISGIAEHAGLNLLRVRYSPYWKISGAAACVTRGPRGMSLLRLRRSGSFALRVVTDPLAIILRAGDADC